MATQLEEMEALPSARIYMACKQDVSFSSLARSSASRCAIASGSGITSAARVGTLLKAADDLGFKGIINLGYGDKHHG